MRLLPKGGTLNVGAPEDLVLNGSFEEAFRSEGVSFNKFSGAFQMQQVSEKSVQLIGEGEGAIWTRRALEREGFSIKPSANLVVEILTDKGPPKWRASEGSSVQDFHTIYQLMTGIREGLGNAYQN